MMKNYWIWPRRPVAAGFSSALKPLRRKVYGNSVRNSTFRRTGDFTASVRRIQRHHILVVGSFIIGLDNDKPGIGKRTAEVARQYGVDNLNVLFLTPLPGTRLWNRDDIRGPHRPRYVPGGLEILHADLSGGPVYKHLSLDGIIDEMISCDRDFYSIPRILRRVWNNLWATPRAAHQPGG